MYEKNFKCHHIYMYDNVGSNIDYFFHLVSPVECSSKVFMTRDYPFERQIDKQLLIYLNLFHV
jgi:hypothetical protein